MPLIFPTTRSSLLALRGLFALLALSLLAAIGPRSNGAEHNRPNIILIVADDLGYGELGCYGQKWIKTPRIDALAQEGLRFTQFYCGAPVCAPSRCTLMTGKHSGHAAIRNNRQSKGFEKLREQYAWETLGQQPLPDSEITIAELLHANGYATAAIGKWGLGMPGTGGEPSRQGFDLFYGYLCQEHAHNHFPKFLWRNSEKETLPGNNGAATGQTFSQDKFTEEALRFICEHRENPFFLYLPFTIPHLSIQVPGTSLEKYAGIIPEAPYTNKSSYFPHRTPRAGFASMITYMDTSIGQIADLLDELRLSDNTLILFTSDNGPTYNRLGGSDSDFFNSSGPLRGRKGSVYEGGIRVPLIARWPGKIAGGRETDQIAAFWDLLPTLCGLTGIEKLPDCDGISLAPMLLGNNRQPQHDYLYWEFPGYGMQQAVRSDNWKAVRHGIDRGDVPFELYDLRSDVGEIHNIAADHPEIVRRLTSYAAAAHTRSDLFPLFASEKIKAGRTNAAKTKE